jgi:outer membrane lipoprotein-sorting protein
MTAVSKRVLLAILVLCWAHPASAQTADEIVEKYLAAIGGRAALGKLTSRSTSGNMTLSTPAGDVSGTIDILNQQPNKSRTVIKIDLTSLGAGPMTVDQRFNGTTGYALDNLRGDHEITGGQLDNMKNGSFPSPLLNYKEQGATVELSGKEKVGDRDAYVLILKPKTGAPTRQYIDAVSYLPVKQILTIDVPEVGQVEQITEFSDFREVDGIKIPFTVRATSSVQNFTVTVTKV